MQEDTTLSIWPELQAEFDDWEALSDEAMRKFEEWEHEEMARIETVPSLENPCSEKRG